MRENQPHHAGESGRAEERQKKKKRAQEGLQRQRIEARDWPRWKGEFYSSQRMGLGRAEGSSHIPNINQQNGGVKKKQVKE